MVIVQMLVLSQEIHLNYLRIRLLQLKKLVIDMHMKKETDTIHRFFSNAEETEWHWCGSENQGKNSLNITKIPKDIKKTFTKEYGVKWKGR